MNVLFVCMDDYPQNGACTNIINNLFFSGELDRKINRIDVLSSCKSIDEERIINFNGLIVYKSLIWSKIPIKQIESRIVRKPCTSLSGIIIKSVEKMLNRYLYINYIDVISILITLYRIKAFRYDYIITLAGNFDAADAVDCYLRHIDNNCTKHVLYQVDPCSTQYSLNKRFKKQSECFEKKIYTDAYSIVTTDIIKNEIMKNYGDTLQSKVEIMQFPNVNCELFSGIPSEKKLKKSFVFSGSIYGTVRDPSYTLRLFQEYMKKYSNGKMELVFVGPNFSDLGCLSIADIVCTGKVGINESRILINNADFLINIGNVMKNQVPSKLFDYISTGLPIINICKNHDCPTLKYLNKYPLALNLFEDLDIDSQVEMLATFVNDNSNKKVSRSVIESIYLDCTPKYCANQLLEILNNHSDGQDQ